jgi:DNA topoisomerase-3
VEFQWARARLFDKDVCDMLFERVKEDQVAKVVKVTTKRKTKAKPFPMNTIDF